VKYAAIENVWRKVAARPVRNAQGGITQQGPAGHVQLNGIGLSPQSRGMRRHSTVKCPRRLAVTVVAATVGGLAYTPVPLAGAVPAPEVEYMYDIAVRRHYNFPNNDAIGYGYAICDKVTRGEGYPQVMSDVKSDVSPNDEASANYLVSNAVNILCPEQIWQLRNSAASYQPPPS
jgi:Protein of unknown function (DUF732)